MTTRFTDPVRVVIPHALALRLADACDESTDAHLWSTRNIAAARAIWTGDTGRAVLTALARHSARTHPEACGWAVLALPARLDDRTLLRVGAAALSALGTPFTSIDAGTGLWIGGETRPDADTASFGGTGAQGPHIDAPNVEHVPDYTALLILRPDPAGGGASLIGDLHAALADTPERDRELLRRPDYFEGRADDLLGVGAPRLPFPILEHAHPGGRERVRWAAKAVTDPRNTAHRAVLERFHATLARHTRAVTLGRGQLLVCDQTRIAHGRTALGDQTGLADGTRRVLMQTKVAYDASAPAHTLLTAQTGDPS
ncbi:TauD/TfdA family dioxygenase [Embleya sp. MST-111070]|uniref:TauD/TfdA family dioxygenase n=1 Tax=Embleya sp. MST-111070 TaxID=3398231 RepID=UPI003F73DF25